MIKISLDTQLINLNDIYDKKINIITLEEIISLIFHATGQMITYDETWKEYYIEFQRELDKQNKYGWPKLNFTRKEYYKRLDSLTTRSFIMSNNILLLLLQLLYTEKCKKNNIINNIYMYFERYDILNHSIDTGDQYSIDQLSLDKLFEILEKYIIFYINMYNNKMSFEYELSKNILTQLNN